MDDDSHIIGRRLNLRHRALVAGCLSVLLFSGCTNICDKPSEGDKATSESAVSRKEPAQTSPSIPEQETIPSPVIETPPAVTETAVPTEKPTVSDTESNLAKIEPAPAKTPVSPPTTPEPESREKPPQPEKVVPPPLDLKLLEKRLKETSAIGIFTKLALKNQVDDLLDKFRDYYQGHTKITLAQLRQPYEMLIMKVLTLLQDNDPRLAQDLLASREAIWSVLSDPEKFAGL